MGERRRGYNTGGMPSSLKTSPVSNYKFTDTYLCSRVIFPSRAQQPQDWVYNRGQIKESNLIGPGPGFCTVRVPATQWGNAI